MLPGRYTATLHALLSSNLSQLGFSPSLLSKDPFSETSLSKNSLFVTASPRSITPFDYPAHVLSSSSDSQR